MHNVSKIRKVIGHSVFSRIDEEIAKQREKAACYIEELKNIKGVTVISEPVYAKATYPYVAIIFNDADKLEKANRLLKNSGLGVSSMFSQAINEYDFLKGMLPSGTYPNARYVAHNNIRLTTSTFMKAGGMDKVLNALK